MTFQMPTWTIGRSWGSTDVATKLKSLLVPLRGANAEIRALVALRTEGENIMMLSKASLVFAGFVIAAAFSAGTAHAQGTAGTWVFHTGASGACPGLDWHVN